MGDAFLRRIGISGRKLPLFACRPRTLGKANLYNKNIEHVEIGQISVGKSVTKIGILCFPPFQIIGPEPFEGLADMSDGKNLECQNLVE